MSATCLVLNRSQFNCQRTEKKPNKSLLQFFPSLGSSEQSTTMQTHNENANRNHFPLINKVSLVVSWDFQATKKTLAWTKLNNKKKKKQEK